MSFRIHPISAVRNDMSVRRSAPSSCPTWMAFALSRNTFHGSARSFPNRRAAPLPTASIDRSHGVRAGTRRRPARDVAPTGIHFLAGRHAVTRPRRPPVVRLVISHYWLHPVWPSPSPQLARRRRDQNLLLNTPRHRIARTRSTVIANCSYKDLWAVRQVAPTCTARDGRPPRGLRIVDTCWTGTAVTAYLRAGTAGVTISALQHHSLSIDQVRSAVRLEHRSQE